MIKACAQYTITSLYDGADALSIQIAEEGGGLRAHIYSGKRELGVEEISALGRLNWFRAGSALPAAEGPSPSGVSGAEAWDVALERYDESLTGSVVSFADPVGNRALRELAVKLEPVQDLHGYDHPWPAGGGKNLSHFPERADFLHGGITFHRQSEDEYRISGTAVGESGQFALGLPYWDKAIIGPFPAGTYTAIARGLIGQNETDRIVISGCYEDDTEIAGLRGGQRISGQRGTAPDGTGKAVTFTASAPFKLCYYMAVGEGDTVDCTVTCQLEKGSAATVFEPYANDCPIIGWMGTNIVVSPTQDAQNGNTYPVSWQSEAGTVYGGTLEYQGSGLWKLTNTMKRISLGSKAWTWVASISQFMSVPNDSSIKAPPNNNTAVNALCDSYPVVPYNSQRDMSLFIPSSNGNWRLRDSRFSRDEQGASDLKASLADVYLVYELATPIEYTLTTDQLVSSLLGENRIWADAGEISLCPGYETLAQGSYRPVERLHIKYSNDGETFTAEGGDVPGTWIGTLVDCRAEASSVFSDYTWKRFSDDAELRREVIDYTERRFDSLEAVYLAKSDFGSYSESVNAQIEQTARGVIESYGFVSLIEALADRTEGTERFLTEMSGQIRRGMIEDPETHELHLGIAISESLSFTGVTRSENGETYYELSPGQTFGLYTSSGWQFWINGEKRGYFSSEDSMLHVSNIVIGETLQLGPGWMLSTSGGFGLRYTGG